MSALEGEASVRPGVSGDEDLKAQAGQGLPPEAIRAFQEARKTVLESDGGRAYVRRFSTVLDEQYGGSIWETLLGVGQTPSKEPQSSRLSFLTGESSSIRSRGWGSFLATEGAMKAAFLRRPHTLDQDLELFSARLRWKIFKDDRRALLKVRAAENGVQVLEEKRRLLKTGFLLASKGLEIPQTIRLGEKWVLDPGGKELVVKPELLSAPERILWFTSAARAAAEAVLVDQPWPAPADGGDLMDEAIPLEDSILFSEVQKTILDDLILDEDLKALLDLMRGPVFSDADRGLFEALRETGSWIEAGRRLGLKPATTRKRKERLMKRLQPLLGEIGPP